MTHAVCRMTSIIIKLYFYTNNLQEYTSKTLCVVFKTIETKKFRLNAHLGTILKYDAIGNVIEVNE